LLSGHLLWKERKRTKKESKKNGKRTQLRYGSGGTKWSEGQVLIDEEGGIVSKVSGVRWSGLYHRRILPSPFCHNIISFLGCKYRKEKIDPYST